MGGSTRRPLIAIPARFSAHASALRFRAEVVAAKVAAGVFAAGGEPVVVHPYAPQGLVTDAEVADRLAFAHGVLLPGGGDLAAQWYGESADASAYDVDLEQDAFDLAVARVALAQAIPLLSICRGTQVVNVAHGGSLVQNLSDGTHWGTTRQLEATQLTELLGARPVVSCYHHQGIDRLADRLQVAALADDGVIEAVTAPQAGAWYLGVQWHPEDTYESDPAQAAVFEALVQAATSNVRSG